MNTSILAVSPRDGNDGGGGGGPVTTAAGSLPTLHCPKSHFFSFSLLLSLWFAANLLALGVIHPGQSPTASWRGGWSRGLAAGNPHGHTKACAMQAALTVRYQPNE